MSPSLGTLNPSLWTHQSNMSSHLASFFLNRCLSTSTSKFPNLPKIPHKYKRQAIQQAQKALTDYLHGTRSLPYAYAEHIGKNSIFSLCNLMSRLDFSAPRFVRNFQKFLRYNPINEFEFFFESIGIDRHEVSWFLPVKRFFLSEDDTVLNAACALSDYGFPWTMLGMLYKEKVSIFRTSSEELTARLSGFKKYGFENVAVIGICLAFPHLLTVECEEASEVDPFFADMKSLFVVSDLASCIEGNVDSWYDVCKKIRVFYNLTGMKWKLIELMGKRKHVFLENEEEVLIQKAEYFIRFGVNKEEVAALLLQAPELLKLDMETPVICVLKFLRHFGLSSKEVQDVKLNYTHVLGTNRMCNLPQIMRALHLHEWFLNKIKEGKTRLLANYIKRHTEEELNQEYREGLERVQTSRNHIHTMSKLKFLHGIGFGENPLTMKVLVHLHGTSSELQERFDCLLHLGIEFAKLSKMVSMTPKILNQKPEILEQKSNFLCQEMGLSLHYLETFPTFLCFDLENRIKPRYRFHIWLGKMGFCTREYSIASIVATSEKGFIARLKTIHPDAVKYWLDYTSLRLPMVDIVLKSKFVLIQSCLHV